MTSHHMIFGRMQEIQQELEPLETGYKHAKARAEAQYGSKIDILKQEYENLKAEVVALCEDDQGVMEKGKLKKSIKSPGLGSISIVHDQDKIVVDDSKKVLAFAEANPFFKDAIKFKPSLDKKEAEKKAKEYFKDNSLLPEGFNRGEVKTTLRLADIE